MFDTNFRYADTSFPTFPGINLHFINTDSREYIFRPGENTHFNILHCLEGQAEYDADGDLLHFSAGDVFINTASGDTSFYLPIGFFTGIACSIDLSSCPDNLSQVLEDVDVSPAVCAGHLNQDGHVLILHKNPMMQHIFSELCNVPEALRKGYFKVKVLELLLILSGMNSPARDTAPLRPASSQLTLAKGICHYLGTHLYCHTTIDELSEIFHASPTQIKNSFKAVYGETVYQFSRKQKMRAAARVLRTTDSTVLEIAGQFGYDNGSKFANAFRDVFGVTPNEYRICRTDELS